ncbi:hypothetical protein [Bacillus sp. OK048]|uniref:acyltransferase n=1 Tax=Bacillus sp. OK048 TaxID=1882761 RepID=UPI000891A37A|nr:hypothetical protein [Bacillus sp. OK048]SDN05531.1 hypothetical protein SAMN05443253_107299 [Bacillus sp. OK048]
MNKIKFIVFLLRDFPKSVFFNFIVFPFAIAIKMPVRIRYNVKLGKLRKNSVQLNCVPKYFMVKLGFQGAGFVSANHSSFSVLKDGCIIFSGECVIAEGFNIFIDNGVVTIGEGFYSNRNFELQCEREISIGQDVLLGWNVSVRDTDGHKTYFNGIENNDRECVVVNNHVWIASHCTILKGTHLSQGSIVGCNSLVCGVKMEQPNCLLAGVPARVKKQGITWKE